MVIQSNGILGSQTMAAMKAGGEESMESNGAMDGKHDDNDNGVVNGSTNGTDSNGGQHQTLFPKQHQRSWISNLISLLRHLIHVIMFLLALSLAVVYIMRCVYGEYYVPLMKRARRSDKHLMEEYTYYDRQCNVLDLTATKASQSNAIILDDSSAAATASADNSASKDIDKMMTHGAVMIPNLLSPDLIQELRKFVVAKNAAVKGTPAEYPVSQGKRRISYGIEAAEDVAVSNTLKHLHDNPKLKKLLEGLVGYNPSLTEITAITAYEGCPPQAWHSDVKADGYAAKFGRTYSHSYSLFIPLQNTTGKMGATDICLGTHYCTDESLHEVCEANKIGMHQVQPETFDYKNDKQNLVWKAGDSVLLNQQVWHRGGRHSAKGEPERIVFIVSFIGRPNDTRQLARGTYFHMKWNMWGHTWQDLADSAISMKWPYNILRCLHIWKPNDRDYGFDLLTATAMRVANRQNGCTPWDLETLVDQLDRLGLPQFLFGTIDCENKNAWHIFISETIMKSFRFLRKLNVVVLCVYTAIVFVVAAVKISKPKADDTIKSLTTNMGRLLVLYGFVLGIMIYILHGIRSSPWATNIVNGRTLMRPFPNEKLVWVDSDPAISRGPTTLPVRQDVLIGTRMNTRKLGAYRYWMEYHPGNQIFYDSVDIYGGPLYRSYERGLPKVFSEELITETFKTINQTGGRFLQQDYRTGDWRWLNRAETVEYIRLKLFIGNASLLDALKDSLDLLLDECRFEIYRGTSLSYLSQHYLYDLEARLFGTEHSQRKKQSVSSRGTASLATNTIIVKRLKTKYSAIRNDTYWSTFPQEIVAFPLYSEVFINKKDAGLVPGTVIGYTNEDKVKIAIYGEEASSHGVTATVSSKSIKKSYPPVEGERVEANYDEEGDWFPGRLVRVRPNGQADVKYDDGDIEHGVEYHNHFPLDLANELAEEEERERN